MSTCMYGQDQTYCSTLRRDGVVVAATWQDSKGLYLPAMAGDVLRHSEGITIITEQHIADGYIDTGSCHILGIGSFRTHVFLRPRSVANRFDIGSMYLSVMAPLVKEG